MKKYLLVLSFFFLPFVSHAAILYSQPVNDETAYDGFIYIEPTATGDLTHVRFYTATTSPALYRARTSCDFTGSGFCSSAYSVTGFSSWSATTSYVGSGSLDLYWSVPATEILNTGVTLMIDLQVSYDSGSNWNSAYSAPHNNLRKQTSDITFPTVGASRGYTILVNDDSVPADYFLTRIVDYSPDDGDTVATSSATLAMTVYVSVGDYESGMYAKVSYLNDRVDTLGSAPGLTATEYVFPITSVGYTNFSTTTGELQVGRHQVEWSIHRPNTSLWFSVLDFFGLGFITSLDATILDFENSTFVADRLSSWDVSGDALGEILTGNGSLASTTDGLIEAVNDYCNPLSGDFGFLNCASLVLVPSASDLEAVLTNFNTQILTRAPWGYVTRFVQLVVTPDFDALPDITYVFPDEFPEPLAGTTWTISPWGWFYVDGAPLKELKSLGDDPQNVWEIMEEVWKLIVYTSLAYLIVRDLIGEFQSPWGDEVETQRIVASKSYPTPDGGRVTRVNSRSRSRRL